MCFIIYIEPQGVPCSAILRHCEWIPPDPFASSPEDVRGGWDLDWELRDLDGQRREALDALPREAVEDEIIKYLESGNE